jgi:RNA polymerase sigma-70 factor (ECF subfamily)
LSESASDERELIRKIGQRDVAAHRTIFDRYYRRVFGMVRRRLSDDALAEEVVSDVFFEIWRGAETFRGDSKVSTWIFGIAHYKVLSAVRRKTSKAVASVIPTKIETLHRFASDTKPSDELESREALRDALRAIDQLPEGQREALRRSVIEGWNYGEIAEHLGVTENTIKTRVSRARARLRSTAPSMHTGNRA